jgi:predicted ATPase
MRRCCGRSRVYRCSGRCLCCSMTSTGAAALFAVPHSALSVPATLHASLMARLDRLGPAAKEVAQAGAAIGREFGYGLLASATDLPEPHLREGLDRLTNAGLLFVRGVPPESSYIFKHVLVQDSAYGTLLRHRRQRLHGRIAAELENRLHRKGTAVMRGLSRNGCGLCAAERIEKRR